jgi:hypothetical protein
VVVLFLSNCDKTDRCEEILSDLEEIDDQVSAFYPSRAA